MGVTNYFGEYPLSYAYKFVHAYYKSAVHQKSRYGRTQCKYRLLFGTNFVM